jgi:hypothetical protein
MKLSSAVLTLVLGGTNALPSFVKRDAGFAQGEPISADGKGAPLLGMYALY